MASARNVRACGICFCGARVKCMKVRYILFAVFGSLILALALALALLYYLFAERPACSHDNLTYYSAEEPACDKEGYVEHWHCEDCGRDFADSNAVNEIDKLEVPAAHKPKYSPGELLTMVPKSNHSSFFIHG